MNDQYHPIFVKFLVSFIVMSVAVLSFADDAKDASLKTAEKLCKNAYSANIESCSIVFSRMHGNCLACHFIQGGTQAGNIGPTLFSMKQRFPDKAVLRAIIWNAGDRNTNSVMMPFGKHKILTEEQIDKVTEFVHTL